jgi:hypothetical protein
MTETITEAAERLTKLASELWAQKDRNEHEIDELLDDTVHNLTSEVASNVNNGGLFNQVEYLIEQCGIASAEQEIRKLIEEFKGIDHDIDEEHDE